MIKKISNQLSYNFCKPQYLEDKKSNVKIKFKNNIELLLLYLII